MSHSQTSALITTLKRQLKANGLTYQDIAVLLNLSEASIKRLFKNGDISLPRLETICDALGLELSELVQKMSQEQYQLLQLTREQEQNIADDPLLLLIAICCINGYRFEDILNQYTVKESTLISKLAQLDRLQIIELQPNNRIKLCIAANFNWLPSGPIQRFFHQSIKEEFFQTSFNRSTDKLLVSNGLISREGNLELQKRMQRLINDFTRHTQKDASLSLDKRHGNTIVLALRQWQSSLLSNYEK